nr:hypothetical protein [Providencia heimbachae]
MLKTPTPPEENQKTQKPPEEIPSQNPKWHHTHQQPPEEVLSRHPAPINFILNPPSATREVIALRPRNIPTQSIARNIHTRNNKNKTTNHARALSLLTRHSPPYDAQNKNKRAPSRFVYFPTFPVR